MPDSMRRTGVKLEADVRAYRRDIGLSEQDTRKLGRAIDDVAASGSKARTGLDAAARSARAAGRGADDMRAGVERAEKSTRGLRRATDDTTAASGRLAAGLQGSGRVAAAVGEDFDEMRRDLAQLDRQIDQTERGLASLAKAFSRTGGDPAIGKEIRAQQAQLRQMLRVRALLPSPKETTDEAAGHGRRIVAGVASGVVSAAPTMGKLAGPLGIALGLAVVPAAASTIAAGLSAGTGAAIIVGGLVALSKSPAFAAAGAVVGKRYADGFRTEAERNMASAGLRVLERLNAAAPVFSKRFGQALDAVRPYLVPLVDRILAVADAISKTLVDGVKRSGPALRALGDAVTIVGDGINDFLKIINRDGPGASNMIRILAGVIADAIRVAGQFVSVGTKVFRVVQLVDPVIGWLSRRYRDAAGSAADFAAKQTPIPPKLNAVTRAVRGQREALVELSTEMRKQVDPAFALIEAQRTMRKAQNDAAEAVKKHGRNSSEAREATRRLASAAIDLQAKTGALSGSFTGRLTPSMQATFRAAGLTKRQINDVERQLVSAKKAADRYDGRYRAAISITGAAGVMSQLDRLRVRQIALQKGVSFSAAAANLGNEKAARDRGVFHAGGWTGPGGTHDEAGVVHADEFVIKKSSRRRIEERHPGLLEEMNATGQLPARRRPGYAGGGQVWPYPVTAAKTKVPSLAQVLAVVAPSFGSWPSSPSAQRGDSGIWRRIVQLIRASGIRQGSFGNAYRRGDPKWHGSGRAVDWMGYNMDALASYLASKRPLELIHRTNRRDYAYTRGRNMGSFNRALMNAHRNHIHIAMANGGVINEPVVGVGASGASYSFAERGPETVVPGTPTVGGGGNTTTITLHASFSAGANLREAGRQIAESLQVYLAGGGQVRVRGAQVL